MSLVGTWCSENSDGLLIVTADENLTLQGTLDGIPILGSAGENRICFYFANTMTILVWGGTYTNNTITVFWASIDLVSHECFSLRFADVFVRQQAPEAAVEGHPLDKLDRDQIDVAHQQLANRGEPAEYGLPRWLVGRWWNENDVFTFTVDHYVILQGSVNAAVLYGSTAEYGNGISFYTGDASQWQVYMGTFTKDAITVFSVTRFSEGNLLMEDKVLSRRQP